MIQNILPVLEIDLTEEEIWVNKKPERGSHIRVMRMGGLYYHHGIYVSDDEVIHFTGTEDDSILDWSKNAVISSDLKFFLNDGDLEVKEYTDEEKFDLYPVEEIVSYARACIGDDGYNLIFNNCEHFANVCTLGRFRSNQVERIFTNKGRKNKMGLFSWIFGGSKSNSRSTSTTTTTYNYDPDKVKAAQIEADAKVRTAELENERIELMTRAKLDILQAEKESKIAHEEAKARGFVLTAQAITTMQEKLNEIAEKRLLIIENASLQTVRDIERFYNELGAKIQEDDDKYNTEKLPELLKILEQYQEGTPAHKLYMKRIEEDMTLQAAHYNRQLDGVIKRQEQIIESTLSTKNQITNHTAEITVQMLEGLQKNLQQIEANTPNENPMLSSNSNSQLSLPA